MSDNILEIRDLSLSFKNQILVNNISLDIPAGKTSGLVGESGSGKTLTALSILRLLPPGISINSGEFHFGKNRSKSIDLGNLSEKEMNRIRGKQISMIFQEPMTSLNPTMTCGRQLMELYRRTDSYNRHNAKQSILDLFGEVQLPEPERIYQAWPHQLSGGQRQRIMIAMSLAAEPALLIADEPTTALDVTVQKSILNLLGDLQEKYNLSILFITHDLMVLKQIADSISVLYKGSVVESGTTQKILEKPEEAYTQGLIACKPRLDHAPERLPVISDFLGGDVPKTDRFRQEQKKDTNTPILSVSNLNTWFAVKGRKNPITAVNNVSFEVYQRETLGLVGESGSGKTTLGRSISRLIEARSGTVSFKGKNLRELSQSELRHARKDIQVVFQDPYSSLNQRLTVGRMLVEPMEIHRIGTSGKERTGMAYDLLNQVELNEDAYFKYPHQFSGGQRQRIAIARALACQPEFLILDESVSALDVSIQAQILNLLNDLKQSRELTYIFISHDLTVVKYMSDRVMIMKSGEIIETGTSENIYMAPVTEYTRALINSIPK